MTPCQRYAAVLALLALAATAALAGAPRVRALGDASAYFEDDSAPLSWFGALVDYPDQLVLDLGEYDHNGSGSLNQRLLGGGGGIHLRLDEAGRRGVLGIYVQEDLPADAPGGAITVMGARRFGRLSLGLRAMLTSHFDGENSNETWGRGESLYIHSFGLGGRWDAGDRLYGDLALEIANTTSDAADESLWSLPASSVWTGWGARTRWFWAVGEQAVLVPLLDHRRDDRPLLSEAIAAPADQEAQQSSLGLGLNLLPDPDNLMLVSGEWRWGTEEHRRLRGRSTGWDYDASEIDYHEIHVRVGLESRVLPWLSLRGSIQYLRLQQEQRLLRGDLVHDDPDRWAVSQVIDVNTPVTLGCALHAGAFQADLVFNGHWTQPPGTLPFGARPLDSGTYSGLSLRYLF